MNEGHDEFRLWAGAYALGALDPDDRRRFEHHLAGCGRCAEVVGALAPIPGLLGQVDRQDVGDPAHTAAADVIAERARWELDRLHVSRRRWRRAALGGVAASLLLVAGVLYTARTSGSNDADPDRSGSTAVITSSSAAAAAVYTSARGWGTEIFLELDGMPRRAHYQLWAVDDAGTWTAAASWGPTPTGRARVTAATWLYSDTLERVVVTSDNRGDVLVDADV